MIRSIRLRTLAFALAASAAIAPALSGAEPGKVQGKGPTNKAYIVRMADAPVVAYDGGVAGLQATRPGKGQKINPNSAAVTRYAAYLDGKHNAALASVGGGNKLYSYRYTFNGFAAELTPAQADKLRSQPGVLAVEKDEARSLDTSSTPAFLGLSNPSPNVGLWGALSGNANGNPIIVNGANSGGAGEGIFIGIVDGGIWPEHPSFSDRDANGKLVYQQIPGWHGKCTPGEAFAASNCNQKLVGARYYNGGWGGNAGIDETFPFEFNSPRDWGGHGTHTASTAGGNFGVTPTGAASVFGNMSGIAPRARIAAYKVCWATEPLGGGCFGSDSVAAIDQAVADGVDVINFSISGSRTNFRDAVEIAFLFAADAGIFVATSAGNSGPASSTVAHPGPWLTTVAAGTHNRDGQGSVTLGNGVTYNGASVATPVGPVPLIDSTAAGLAGADPTMVALCFAAEDNEGEPVLDPAKIAGKIVVCDRGVTARINKSLAVQQGGGAGMILVNTSPNSINADLHFVPTVHLQNTDRAAVKTYAATAGATATINASTLVFNAPAPFTAAFSSRGPLLAGNGDLLKPDVSAPGQDILAAVAPPGNHGRLFDVYSGTSMSSPHVAGLAALLKDLHPTWSPMKIKSALMTTGGDVLDGPNTNPLVIFRQGAGHVRPNIAADPGLVFDSGFNDWLNFICGTQPGSFCAAFTPIDPSDLNVASIAIGDLAGIQKVKRKVTNVGETAATYNVSHTGLAGVDVSVSPSSFAINPGASQELEITFTRTTAALSSYAGGQMTWTDGTHNVRVPLVVRPVALAAPTAVFGTGGPINYDVKFGYTGPFSATARGLIPPAITAGTVPDDPTNGTCDLTVDPSKIQIPVTIAAGTTYARFSLFDADVAAGSDIDLCVFRGTTLVGASTSGTSAEEVNLVNPAADNYTVVVHGWGVPGTSPFKLHTWLLGTADAGNMTVTAPASAVLGQTGTINLTFSGLAPATRYLGSVAYSGIAGLPNPTIVRVDTP